MIDEELYNRIVKETKWSPEAARVGMRAKFQCEYCDLDFLESPENYKLIQIDHIVPLSVESSLIDLENLALACKQCNFSFKRRFDPRSKAGKEARRDQLIQVVRGYIQMAKAKTAKEIAALKTILGPSRGHELT